MQNNNNQQSRRRDMNSHTSHVTHWNIQTKALAKGHYSATVSALTVKAKLSGHWIDRTDNKTSNVVYAVADEPLTEDEWIAKHAGG
jgi:hypothetical protein